MNRDEILSMEPGRELDALVAEKVMGWKTNWLKTDWWEEINPNTHRHKGLVKDFKPSTDIAAAFDVEEKIYHMDKVGLVGRYVTELLLIVGSNGFKMVHATPEQRCKAALLAVMVE